MAQYNSKSEKMFALLTKTPMSIAQITHRCGFAGENSVTSLLAKARKRGVNVVVKGTTKDGFNKYAIM